MIAALSPDLCRAIDHYCERTDPSLWSEPMNALTNAAFPLGAWFAWRLAARHTGIGHRKLIGSLIAMTAIVGFGSFLFHSVATRWAEWGDVIPILVFMLLYLWLILTCFFRWPDWRKLAALAVFFAITFYLEAAVPGTVLWGGALYLPTVLVFVVIAWALHRMGSAAAAPMIAATAVFLLSLMARSLDTPLCSLFPQGTHFLWHLLNALLLFLLLRLAILHAPRGFDR
ncbi:MAG TPA: ceramidase domain-containing protein [Dongiaceae bacterium]